MNNGILTFSTIKTKNPAKEIPVECFDRCCGYYRPIAQFNKGKQEEHNERKRTTITQRIIDKVVDENK